MPGSSARQTPEYRRTPETCKHAMAQRVATFTRRLHNFASCSRAQWEDRRGLPLQVKAGASHVWPAFSSVPGCSASLRFFVECSKDALPLFICSSRNIRKPTSKMQRLSLSSLRCSSSKRVCIRNRAQNSAWPVHVLVHRRAELLFGSCLQHKTCEFQRKALMFGCFERHGESQPGRRRLLPVTQAKHCKAKRANS